MKTSTLRSKPLVVFVLLAVILAGGLLSPGAPGASASTPLNVKLTNVLDKQFTVTWTTAVGEVGSVRWGTSVGSQPNTASDGRGTSYSGRTHHVTITGLAASTAYTLSSCLAGTPTIIAVRLIRQLRRLHRPARLRRIASLPW